MEFQAGDIALINGHEYIIEDIDSDTVTVHYPDFLDMKSTLFFDGNEWRVMDYDTPHTVIFRKEVQNRRFFTDLCGVPCDAWCVAQASLG